MIHTCARITQLYEILTLCPICFRYFQIKFIDKSDIRLSISLISFPSLVSFHKIILMMRCGSLYIHVVIFTALCLFKNYID